MGRPPIGDVAMTGAERVRRHRLKHGLVTNVTKPDDDRIRVLEAELERERAEIAALKAELERERERHEAEAKAAPAKAATLPPSEAERTIKRLRERNRSANAEIRHLRDWSKKTGISEKGGMSYTTHRKLMKVLHPDVQPSEAEREEACKAFNAWIDGLKPARR
jgi:hypothetical protein